MFIKKSILDSEKNKNKNKKLKNKNEMIYIFKNFFI